MPISFLAPLFLAGLAALAIPILIHLTDRERRDVVAFPSLMFVQRIPHQTVRRQRIRHWLLFLLRSAAVTLLVLAFARPLLDRAGAAGAFRGGRDVVILLDRSFSMAYGDRWTRGVEAARRTVAGIGEADRATLVAFAERAEALTQPTSDPVRLRTALDEVGIEDAATRYTPALQLAAQILEDSELPRREVIVISDFQRAGWNPQDAVRLPTGTVVTAVNLADDDGSNLAVTDVVVDRHSGGTVDHVAVAARLVNTGTAPRRDVPVTLEIDGQRVASRLAAVDALGATLVRFEATSVPRRTALGTVAAGSDRLERDNRFHFVMSPQQAVPVLLIQHPSAGAGESVYLTRALGIGNDPSFALRVGTPSRLASEDLARRPAVILNDVPYPGGAVGRRLAQYVSDGGRLLVVLGKRSAPATWNAARSLFPGTAGEPVDRWADRGGTFAIVSYDHPALEIFKAPRSGDFSTARFFRYLALDVADSVTVLARFDDGGVALAAKWVGRGNVLVLTTSLDNVWNDLTLQPVFLPFVHQIVRYLAAYGAPRPWVTAGQVLDLAAYTNGGAPDGAAPGEPLEVVVEAPSGARTLRMVGAGDDRYLAVREQGFHRVRTLENRAEPLATIAVNLDPGESDLATLDPDELVGAVAAEGVDQTRAAAAFPLTPQEKERRQGLWWYLLIAVLLLLVAESVVSNRTRSVRR